MKHALAVLIVIFVLVLIVLPLIYISLGKIKSPLDKIKLGSQGALTGQNYIPVTRDQADPTKIYNSDDQFDLKFEKECNATGLSLTPKDVTTLFNQKEKKASITSDTFKFTWTLSGLYEKTVPYGTNGSTSAVLFAGGEAPESYLVMSLWAGKYTAKECVGYYAKKFGAYHDSGRFLKEVNWEKQGLVLLEKGLTRVNGYSYYWYMFEDMRKRDDAVNDADTGGSLLTESKVSNQTFTIIYETFNNGTKYRASFTGDRTQNKSYRNIQQAANKYLGGLKLF